MKKLQKLLSLSLLAIAVTACGPGSNVNLGVDKETKEVIFVKTVEKITSSYKVLETRIIKADNKLGKLHSVDGKPSVVTIKKSSGKTIEVKFHKKGKLHRDVGPAYIGYDVQFYKNGKQVIKWDREYWVLIAPDHSIIQNSDELTNEEFEVLGGEAGIENYSTSGSLLIPIVEEARELQKSFDEV